MNAPISALSSALQQMQAMSTQAAGGAGQVASGSVVPESGAASAGSFVGQANARSWRGWAHLGTAASLTLVVFLYWPRRG